MNKTKKTLIAAGLVLLMLLLGLLAARESQLFWQQLRGIEMPSAETRRQNPHQMPRYLNVKEVAVRCHKSETEVFAALGITPAAGDEQLSLRELGDKYRITVEEMQNRLRPLRDSSGRNGAGKNHE